MRARFRARRRATVGKNQLKELQGLSPEEYEKKAKKLPDTTKLPGKAPHKDNKKPGGGNGGRGDRMSVTDPACPGRRAALGPRTCCPVESTWRSGSRSSSGTSAASTYEMAIRDHFRLDVLMRAAAELQRVDAELGEVERLLRMERGGAAGNARLRGAARARGGLLLAMRGRLSWSRGALRAAEPLIR